MTPTTKRICRIAVTLRPNKVYIITLDHCIENLVLQRLTGYLIPLARYYWGFDKGTKLEYEEFGGFTEEIIHIGFEIWKDLGDGILDLDKAECLTPSDEALKDLINQLRIYYQSQELRIYYQSQELSQKIGESLKKIIKEELEKKNHDLNRVGYAALCSSAPYILEDACNYAKNTLVL